MSVSNTYYVVNEELQYIHIANEKPKNCRAIDVMKKICKLTDLTSRNYCGENTEKQRLTPGQGFLLIYDTFNPTAPPLESREGRNLIKLKYKLNNVMNNICIKYERKYNKLNFVFKLLNKLLEHLGFLSELTQIKNLRKRVNSNITEAERSAIRFSSERDRWKFKEFEGFEENLETFE